MRVPGKNDKDYRKAKTYQLLSPDKRDSANTCDSGNNAESHSLKESYQSLDQMRKNFCMVEKLPSVQSKMETQIMVILTTGGKKEKSKRLRKLGPENRNLIHLYSAKSEIMPMEDPIIPWRSPSSRKGVLM